MYPGLGPPEGLLRGGLSLAYASTVDGEGSGFLFDPSGKGFKNHAEDSLASIFASRAALNHMDGGEDSPYGGDFQYGSIKKATALGAPKGALPPLPWQLGNEKQRQAYANGGSAFIRNIGAKAQELALQVAEEKKMNQERYRKALDATSLTKGKSIDDMPEFNWGLVTGQSQSNPTGRTQSGGLDNSGGLDVNPEKTSSNQGRSRKRKEKGRKNGGTSMAAKFDPDRLLHPWQRHLEEVKRAAAVDESLAMEMAERGPEKVVSARVAGDPLKIVDVNRNHRTEGRGEESHPSDREKQFEKHLGSQKILSTKKGKGLLPPLVESAPPSMIVLESPDLAPTSTSSLSLLLGSRSPKRVAVSNNSNSLLLSPKSVSKDVDSTRAAIMNCKGAKYSLEDNMQMVNLGPVKTSPRQQIQQSQHIARSYLASQKNIEIKRANAVADDDGEDDDDDEDDAIGWSPFVIPTNRE